jgi:uncharacterized repeat protein (TIGR01451 family)
MTEEIVFADAAGVNDALHDGKHSDNDAYKVVTAKIDVTKFSCVVSDPINGTTNPHRIPGAVVRYAIDVNNTGSAAATNASLSDTLSGNLTYSGNALIATETCNCATPGASNGDTVSESGGVVTANYGTVASGTHECAYFEVTIN